LRTREGVYKILNPFRSHSAIHEINPKQGQNFIVCGMYTKEYFEMALRLKNSLERFNLPYGLFEIPTIHSSISYRGNSSSEFNKPKFISAMFERYKLPVLYIDVDCVIDSYPQLIDEILNEGYEFAIFNWLSSERNDAYVSVNLPGLESNRFYVYSHGINQIDEGQLRCSGAVQLWSNKDSTRELLNIWNETILRNPFSADDECLDYAFNNFKKNIIKAFWLPKSYARYAFWIFDKPAINHPDFPSIGSKFKKINLEEGKFLVDESHIKPRQPLFYIQPNMLLDTLKNHIVVYQNGIFLKVSNNQMPIYIQKN